VLPAEVTVSGVAVAHHRVAVVASVISHQADPRRPPSSRRCAANSCPISYVSVDVLPTTTTTTTTTTTRRLLLLLLALHNQFISVLPHDGNEFNRMSQ